jgi:ABC-type Mn2+/Zn2+ transport system ATPase subunit
VSTVIEDERRHGRTVVVATHDLGDAEPADLVFLLSHGIVAQGAPDAVLTNENLRRTYGFTERH